MDYTIKLTGKPRAVSAEAAAAIGWDKAVKNAAVFCVEIADNVTHYGRGESKVTSGMSEITDNDVVTIGGTRYLALAKGLKADKSIDGGAYFSVGTAAGTVSKSYIIDASGVTLA